MKQAIYASLAAVFMTSCSYAIDLYDGSDGSTLAGQGWLYLQNPLFTNQSTYGASGGTTTLDTTAVTSDQAGFFSHLPGSTTAYHPDLQGIVLNRLTGFSLDFGVQLFAETHNSTDRAGFSIILLSSDLLGIELGFWANQIWAQSGPPADVQLFDHAESSATFDTTSSLIDYSLAFYQDTYTLYAAANPVLTGSLRDYSSFGLPYTTANFIFFGDDTSSAEASAAISYINLNQQPAAVPEPASILLCVFAAAGYFLRKNKIS